MSTRVQLYILVLSQFFGTSGFYVFRSVKIGDLGDGTLRFVWDNKFSWTRGKTVQYRIQTIFHADAR